MSLTVSHLVPHAVLGPSPSGAAKENLDLAHLCTHVHTSIGLGTGQQACSHLIHTFHKHLSTFGGCSPTTQTLSPPAGASSALVTCPLPASSHALCLLKPFKATLLRPAGISPAFYLLCLPPDSGHTRTALTLIISSTHPSLCMTLRTLLSTKEVLPLKMIFGSQGLTILPLTKGNRQWLSHPQCPSTTSPPAHCSPSTHRPFCPLTWLHTASLEVGRPLGKRGGDKTIRVSK